MTARPRLRPARGEPPRVVAVRSRLSLFIVNQQPAPQRTHGASVPARCRAGAGPPPAASVPPRAPGARQRGEAAPCPGRAPRLPRRRRQGAPETGAGRAGPGAARGTRGGLGWGEAAGALREGPEGASRPGVPRVHVNSRRGSQIFCGALELRAVRNPVTRPLLGHPCTGERAGVGPVPGARPRCPCTGRCARAPSPPARCLLIREKQKGPSKARSGKQRNGSPWEACRSTCIAPRTAPPLRPAAPGAAVPLKTFPWRAVPSYEPRRAS